MMNYTNFISHIEHYQTAVIKSLSYPQSCDMTSIPEVFSFFLPTIIRILHHHREKLCKKDETVRIFSMQTSAGAIISTWAQQANRFINTKNPQMHVCYSLNYLALPIHCQKIPETWVGARSVIIDFTRGRVMDAAQFLFEISHQGKQGVVYGELDAAALELAWRIIRNE